MPSIVNDRTAPARRVLGFELIRADETTHIAHNRAVHRMLVDGVTVEYRGADGSIAGAQARVIEFDVPANNDWLAANQFTVAEGQHTRRPDVVLFVNGLLLASRGPTTFTQWADKLRWRRRLIGSSGRGVDHPRPQPSIRRSIEPRGIGWSLTAQRCSNLVLQEQDRTSGDGCAFADSLLPG